MFDYQTNFRQMLIRLMGIINIEKVQSVDQGKLTKLMAVLDGLKMVAQYRSAYTYQGCNPAHQCTVSNARSVSRNVRQSP